MQERRFIILFLTTILFFLPVLGYCQTSTVDISVSAEVPGEVPPPAPAPPTPTGGGVTVPTPAAKVIFEGRAYPNAFLTILRNDVVAATFLAKSSGLFKKELTGIPGGVYTFGIWAEDTEGRKSVTLSFTVSILAERTTTISGIFISPTISLRPTQVERGERVDIFGQAFPESQINIFISSPKETVKETFTDEEGKWTHKLNTAPLEEREHKARAKALYGDGEQSPFSQTLSFLVLVRCWGADLNFDGKVNLVDFSILLYFWHSISPENICVDINQDGIVNLIDFSIMMYEWTE